MGGNAFDAVSEPECEINNDVHSVCPTTKSIDIMCLGSATTKTCPDTHTVYCTYISVGNQLNAYIPWHLCGTRKAATQTKAAPGPGRNPKLSKD